MAQPPYDPPVGAPPQRSRGPAIVGWVVTLCIVAALIWAGYALVPWGSIFGGGGPAPPPGTDGVWPAQDDFLAGGPDTVTALAFSIDADIMSGPFYNFLVAGTVNGELYVFDAVTWELVEHFTELSTMSRRVNSLSVGSVSDYDERLDQARYRHEYIAATQVDEACVLLWDPSLPAGRRTLELLTTGDTGLGGPFDDVFYDCFSRNILAFSMRDQAVREWELDSGEIVYVESRPAELEQIRRLSRSINGRYTAVEYQSGGTEVFDAWEATGGLTDYGLPVFEVVDNYGHGTAAMAVSSLGYLASTAGTEGNWQVDVVDMLEPDTIRRIPTAEELSALAFSFHGDLLAGGGPGYVLVWDARSGEQLHRIAVD